MKSRSGSLTPSWRQQTEGPQAEGQVYFWQGRSLPRRKGKLPLLNSHQLRQTREILSAKAWGNRQHFTTILHTPFPPSARLNKGGKKKSFMQILQTQFPSAHLNMKKWSSMQMSPTPFFPHILIKEMEKHTFNYFLHSHKTLKRG